MVVQPCSILACSKTSKSIFIRIHLSVCLYVCLSVCLSVCLPIRASVCIRPFVRASVKLMLLRARNIPHFENENLVVAGGLIYSTINPKMQPD